MVFVNHYFYLWDSEWGGAFWKTNAYAPFPIWLWLRARFGPSRAAIREYIEAHNDFPEISAYCLSKTGVVKLTRSPASEWASHGIHVNPTAP